MDKKEIAALKKLAKTGHDLMGIMAKYLKVLEDAIGTEMPDAQNQKTTILKKSAAKPVAVKKTSDAKKAPAIKKAPVVKKATVKAKEAPAAKLAAKPIAKTVAPKVIAPVKKVVAPEPQKISKRGRPAKEKK